MTAPTRPAPTAVTVAPGRSAHTAAGGPGAPVSSRALRPTSRNRADFPPVTGREEEWRYTPLARLRGLLDGPPADAEADIEVLSGAGVTVRWVPMSDPVVGSVLTPADRLSATAMDSSTQALVVAVAPEAILDSAVRLTIRAGAGVSYGHVVVDVGADARATVVIEHRGGGRRAVNTEVRIGDRAHVTLVDLHEQDRDAVHVEAQAVLVGRDATFRHTVVTLGGDLVRLTPVLAYAGPGGDAELAGLYLTGADQHHEHQLFVDHEQPHCRSRVLYKGALQGAGAHAIWVGDVHIGAAAEGTDTYELNRNLVLTDGARADSVPNLEIETGEVAGAGHASATGRFDDEQLFYCMARGIPEVEARRLVVRGFFTDVLGRIEDGALRERLLATVDTLLESV